MSDDGRLLPRSSVSGNDSVDLSSLSHMIWSTAGRGGVMYPDYPNGAPWPVRTEHEDTVRLRCLHVELLQLAHQLAKLDDASYQVDVVELAARLVALVEGQRDA